MLLTPVDCWVRSELHSPVDPMMSLLYTPVECLKLTELRHNLVMPVKPMDIDPLSVGLTDEPENPHSAHSSMLSPVNL